MAGPVDLILLRGLLADLPLTKGATVAATVVQRDGQRGLLSMGGARVWATLPQDVDEGQRLRLRVTEATSERVTLQVVHGPEQEAPADQTQAASQQQALMWTGAVPLPGGAQARLIVERDQAGDKKGAPAVPRSIVVRYDSPALGRLDMLVSPEGVTISAPAGGPADAARAASEELRDALRAATGRAATVVVHGRTDTVDLRA